MFRETKSALLIKKMPIFILYKQTHFRIENIADTLVKEEEKYNKYDFVLVMHLVSLANREKTLISCLQHKVKCREIVLK